MSDKMNVNNQVWTIRVPNNTSRIVNQNLWQYDMFGAYPNDSLAALNDTALFKFDNTASLFLDETARLSSFVGPLLKMLEAQNAQWAQIAAMNISKGNPSINIVNKTTKPETDEKDSKDIDGTKEIKESQIKSTLERMGALDSRVGNKKIEYIDPKTGEKKEIELLKRLIQLSKDYQENPDNPEKVEISDENYELLWDIAGRYAKSEGDLSRADYLKLIEIAKNPGGPGAYRATKEEVSKAGLRPEKNQAVLDAALAGAPDNYESLATEFKEALYCWGTDTDKLNNVKSKIDKNNVVEFSKYFHERYGEDYGENVLEAIFADCDSWGRGNHWYTDDDPKPYVSKLSNSLIERTEDLIKNNPKMNDEDKKALQNACTTLADSIKDENIKYPWWSTDMSSDCAKGISSNYQDLLDKLTKMEKSIYGED